MVLNFSLDKEDFHVEIQLPYDGAVFRTDVNHLKGRIRIPNEGQVRITRVDMIRKNLKLDFLNL